ncbi:NACHT domain-containing protein [Actinoplanes sp. CA-142083]|uniref:NACHT domain-containing protein n=1 Tax=Actinoplanes sp. CA-142083 TaxID=3239903 RepID=UPI003D94F2F2
MKRVAQAVIVTALSAVALPILINILTGGTLTSLRSNGGKLQWAAVAALFIVLVALTLWPRVRGLITPIDPHRIDHPRNARNAMEQVRKYVQQRIEGSLAQRARIELGFDERPDAVAPPANLVQRVQSNELTIEPGTPIRKIYDELQGVMLILGAPGAGKTTLLLDLAASLAEDQDQTGAVVPVVIDLAEWADMTKQGLGRTDAFWLLRRFWPRKLPMPDWVQASPTGFRERQTTEEDDKQFLDWLLDTIHRRFKIPATVAQAWLTAGRLGLLLDGLDEVLPASQEQCITLINRLTAHYPIRDLVVCCRENDYERLRQQLRLQGALAIRPLTPEQVIAYVTSATVDDVHAVADVLNTDPELMELLTTPLMMNIMALAYGGGRIGPLARNIGTNARRRELFDAYLVEVIARRVHPRAKYQALDVLHSLRILAATSIRLGDGPIVRHPDVDTWEVVLPRRTAWFASMIVMPVAAVSFMAAATFLITARTDVVTGMVSAFSGLLVFRRLNDASAAPRRPGRPGAFRVGLALVAAAGIGVGLALGAVIAAEHFETALRFLHETLMKDLIGLLFVTVGIAAAMILFDSEDRATALLAGGATGLAAGIAAFIRPEPALRGYALGLLIIAIGTAVMHVLSFRTQSGPHGQHLRSMIWRRHGGLLPLFAACVAYYLGADASPYFALTLLGCAGSVLPAVLIGQVAIVVFRSPLVSVLQGLVGDAMPWRRRFLRYAVDRCVLLRTDGEYRFVHILVRNHLVQSDLDQLAEAIGRRSAQMERS